VTDRETDKYRKTKHFLDEMYPTICVEWAVDNYDRGVNRSTNNTKICTKTIFYIFEVRSQWLWP